MSEETSRPCANCRHEYGAHIDGYDCCVGLGDEGFCPCARFVHPTYEARMLRSPFSDDFWLLYVLSAELSSKVVTEYYDWRTRRDALWGRVLRRWEGKHR